MSDRHSIQYYHEILKDIRYEDYLFELVESGADREDIYLQGVFFEPDIRDPHGTPVEQKTRKWKISRFMTRSEFVQTVFKLSLTSSEHRCREKFRYKGSAVYSPHYHVDALLQLCRLHQFDYRSES